MVTHRGGGHILSAETMSVTRVTNGPSEKRPRRGRVGGFIRGAVVRVRVTVKDEVGRSRYVAFRVVGPALSRAALSGVLPPSAKLTRFDGTHGIVRTLHRDRDAVVAFLRGLARAGEREIRLETLAVSGTLRKAAEALPPHSRAAKREPRKR